MITGQLLVRVVVFVDISGSSRLYKELGDASAARRVRACLSQVREVVAAHGGRTIKEMGDGLMCDFALSDQALLAAQAMQLTVGKMEEVADPSLNIRVGCHRGHLIENAGDLFGDTVNIASRMADVATAGQIITTEETVAAVSPVLRTKLRPLDRVSVKGQSNTVAVFEYLWQDRGDATIIGIPAVRDGRTRLCVTGGQQQVYLDRNTTIHSIRLGRNQACELAVADPAASRLHATIEVRGDNFVLTDHSVNGTYVAWGTTETCVKREGMILPTQGRLALGAPTAADGVTVLTFWRES